MRSSERPPGFTTGGSSRFSSTSSEAKMPRSSGQKAMPARAMSFEAREINSRPPNRTEPVRRDTIPMIDLRVVVLPAPLRPSSVTTSPARTAKLTPCSTCDSPYHACRPSTARSAPSSMNDPLADPEIGFAHFRIGRHARIVALGEHAAAGENRDAVAQIGDDTEIVLDHQDRAVHRDRLDEGRDAPDVLVAHPGRRLVEQQHFR